MTQNDTSAATPRTQSEVTSRTGTARGPRTDGELVDGLIGREDGSWRELVARFEPPLRRTVRRTLTGALREMMESDAIDDIMQDFYVDLLERDAHKLRLWALGPRKAALLSWLSMIVSQIAIEHFRRAALRQGLPTRLRANQAESDDERATRWLGSEQSAGERPRRKRATDFKAQLAAHEAQTAEEKPTEPIE